MNGIRPESIMTINDGGSRLNNSQGTNTLRCCEFQLNPFDSAASSKQKTSDQFIIDISPLSLLIWRVAGQTSGAPFFTFSSFFFLPFFFNIPFAIPFSFRIHIERGGTIDVVVVRVLTSNSTLTLLMIKWHAIGFKGPTFYQ